jgi:WD40 repeat protein
MAGSITPVRIFISSPGDLVPERAVVRAVLDQLNRSANFRDRFKLIPYAWEHEAPALMGRAAQEVVDTYVLQPAQADILVCMLWQRMGSAWERIDPQTNQPYQSGTEYEFFQAYRAYESAGRPLLLLYRCIRQPAADVEVEPEQAERVRRFFERFLPGGDLKGLVGTFVDATDFEITLKRDIALLLEHDIAGDEDATAALGQPWQVSNNRRQGSLRGYDIQELIGSGGFGAVYRAYQPALRREVAIKVIKPQYANHPDFIRRFEAEAQFIARLEHPHVVPLYDYWREPSGAYLVMRHVRGGSLAGKLRAGPWSLDDSIRLLDQLSAALTYTHRQQIVHRDLKPANILLDDQGHAYLADFGIAKDLGGSASGELSSPELTLESPVYLSPEQILNEAISPQSDIYSLGMILYELLTGVPPFGDLSPDQMRTKHLYEALPPLQHYRPGLPEELNKVVLRATAKRPSDRYPNVASLFSEFVQISGAGSAPTAFAQTYSLLTRDLHAATDRARVAPGDASAGDDVPAMSTRNPPVENPYKGLRSFVEADAADFFGRTRLTQRLLTRLAEPGETSRFLALVGPSGSGKSSVVRAGLVPALRGGALAGSASWFVTTMLPGAHPWEELEAALLRVAINPPASLLEQLQENERGFARAVKRALPPDNTTELVLIIDQFEELFTLVEHEAVRAQVLESLLVAVQDPRSRVRVIVTLRADFYDRPLLYPGIGELMRQRTEVVLPLTQEELRDAIVRPAEQASVQIEPALVATMMHDVAAQPGVLPLLQYALTELFEQRAGPALTLASYQASHGVQGMLARRADELYESLDSAAQANAKHLFLRLIALGEGTEDTRRRVPLAELTGIQDANWNLNHILNLYGGYRLLTFDHDPLTREPTVEVAHEALIRNWGRLREWLEASRDALRIQRRLAAAAAEWTANNREPSFLARGRRLEQFAAWTGELQIALNDEERAYLDASLADRDVHIIAEQQRKRREIEARHLALSAGAQAALYDGNTSLALALAMKANQTDSPVIQSQIILSDAAYTYGTRRIYRAHQGEVQAVALSPDGKSFISGGEDTILMLQDLATGDILRTFTGHRGKVQCLSFSPDGTLVLSGAEDTKAILWNSATGRAIHVFEGHTAVVTDVAFSPDGTTALSASTDATLMLWDVAAGQPIRSLVGHSGAVYAASFSPDGKTALSASSDTTLRLWDVDTGATITILKAHTKDVYDVAFSPDGQQAASCSGDLTILVWDLVSGQVIQKFVGHTNDVWRIVFSPDGQTLLSASRDTSLGLWSLEAGRLLFFLKGHGGSVRGAAYSQNGRQVLSASIDGTLRLWDLTNGAEISRFANHKSSVNRVILSPGGTQALTASSDKTLLLWDTATREVLQQLRGHEGEIYSAAISPDGKTAISGADDRRLILWDLGIGTSIRVMAGHSGGISTVAFRPGGRTALSGSIDKTLILWNLETGQQICQLTGHTGEIYNLALSSDGRLALSASGDKTLLLWDLETEQCIRTFEGHQAFVRAVAFSRDDRTALSGGDDKMLLLWDVASGTIIRRFVGHTAGVRDVVFSTDGTLALSGSSDTHIMLWDVASGQPIRRYAGHTKQVRSVALSPDSRTALSASSDGTARLWRIDTLAQLIEWVLNNRDLPDLIGEQE